MENKSKQLKKKVTRPSVLIKPTILAQKIKKIFAAQQVDIGDWFASGPENAAMWRIYVYIKDPQLMAFSALEKLSELVKTKDILIFDVVPDDNEMIYNEYIKEESLSLTFDMTISIPMGSKTT